MQINFDQAKASYFITLQSVLENHSLNELSQDEITFLQLYFLEKLSTEQISELTGKDLIYIESLSEKFTPQSMI